jgi:transposase
MGRTVEVMSCYEAGFDGFWLHRQLEAHGVRNYVIDPAILQTDRRPRGVKMDRIDTEAVAAFVDGVSTRSAESVERAAGRCRRGCAAAAPGA